MKLAELKTSLSQNPGLNLRFILPSGEAVAAHAHVTEVARVEKRFVDCGGTLRNDAFCRLQTWVAGDLHHRLTAGKLLGILTKAAPILLADDLEVDIEHEFGVITQFPLTSVHVEQDEIILSLSQRHTACLAEDKCMRPPPVAQAFSNTSVLSSRQVLDFKPLPKFTLPPIKP